MSILQSLQNIKLPCVHIIISHTFSDKIVSLIMIDTWTLDIIDVYFINRCLLTIKHNFERPNLLLFHLSLLEFNLLFSLLISLSLLFVIIFI